LQQFQLNMDAADSTDELKLEVTAPTIASKSEQRDPFEHHGQNFRGICGNPGEKVRWPRVGEGRHADEQRGHHKAIVSIPRS
jgi:hypothetical protein